MIDMAIDIGVAISDEATSLMYHDWWGHDRTAAAPGGAAAFVQAAPCGLRTALEAIAAAEGGQVPRREGGTPAMLFLPLTMRRQRLKLIAPCSISTSGAGIFHTLIASAGKAFSPPISCASSLARAM